MAPTAPVAPRAGGEPRPLVVDIDVCGEFSLIECARFLAGFPPAVRPDAGDEHGVLRLAFPVEGTSEHAGALVRQRAPNRVTVEASASPHTAHAVVEQVRRLLSLDVDGEAFSALDHADPILGRLRRQRRGLRPVLFPSPYEAACWAVVCHRFRVAHAASVKRLLAVRHGRPVEVAGATVHSFPAPEVLADVPAVAGLSVQKVRRLRAVAEAAADGRLDATMLRAMPLADAMEQVRGLPGIGPFSAELVVAQGAGHPDVFPLAEHRLHEEMTWVYGLRDGVKPAELEEIAQRWRPYRSWGAFLLRARKETTTDLLPAGGQAGNDSVLAFPAQEKGVTGTRQ
ncbi:DNA-3-methyladenine glycosylase 2 family protein [Saccharomonospora sp. NPDC006951]